MRSFVNRACRVAAAFALLIVSFCAQGLASDKQTSPPTTSPLRVPVLIPTPAPAGIKSACASAMPEDAGLRASCEMALQYNGAVYAHGERLMEIQERQFESQLADDRPIFWVVIGIVVVGLGLSIAQFVKGFLFARTAPENDTQLKLDVTAGVEIKSSVIGLVILAMSLGFFFLYLKFVYSINPAGG